VKKSTDQTLLDQMRITELELDYRKSLFSFTDDDARMLAAFRPSMDQNIDPVVARFYEQQTGNPEIALLIGDRDTLQRLQSAQRRYILDLFSGQYDLAYVNNRLRIGLVHKRIGVEPKLYLSAVYSLNQMLRETIIASVAGAAERMATLAALEKLMQIDVTFVFDTYVRSLVSEIEVARNRAEQFGRNMEQKVHERTLQLQQIARSDPLTGLLNVRHLNEIVTRDLRAAQRRGEPICAVYMDVDDFKAINDTHGHQRGDEVLCFIGEVVKSMTRVEDSCFRYGGDEFCLFLINCTEVDARAKFVGTLRQRTQECPIAFTVSCGVAQTGPDEYLSVEELIRQADHDMYRAKKAAATPDR